MRKNIHLLISLVIINLLITLFIFKYFKSIQETADSPPPGDKRFTPLAEERFTPLAEEKIRLALERFEMAQERYETVTGTHKEVYEWSINLLNAENTLEFKYNNFINHYIRMMRMKKLLDDFIAKNPMELPAHDWEIEINYYVKESEIWLIEKRHR